MADHRRADSHRDHTDKTSEASQHDPLVYTFHLSIDEKSQEKHSIVDCNDTKINILRVIALTFWHSDEQVAEEEGDDCYQN